MYLGCLFCFKKLEFDGEQTCPHCHKFIAHGIYRYILNIKLIDAENDIISAKAYNNVGEKLLAFEDEDFYSAHSFANDSDEEILDRIKKLSNKKLRLKIISFK